MAAPSPTTVVPGLALLEEKHHNIVLAPLLMNSRALEGLTLPCLQPTAARFRLAGIFMADLKLLLAAVPSRDKQHTVALISGLKLTDPLLLDLWNESGQTNSPQSVLDGSALILNDPQLMHVKEVKGRTLLTARDVKHEFKTSLGWSPL